jgi:hypothetical protein
VNAPLIRNVVFISLLAGALVACRSHPALTSGASVERDIRAHLSVGSSRTEVLSYLDKRKIPYHWLKRGEGYVITSSLTDPDTGLPIPDTPTIAAIVPHSEADVFVTMSGIQIDFKFDATGSKLVDFKVQELLTGP